MGTCCSVVHDRDKRPAGKGRRQLYDRKDATHRSTSSIHNGTIHNGTIHNGAPLNHSTVSNKHGVWQHLRKRFGRRPEYHIGFPRPRHDSTINDAASSSSSVVMPWLSKNGEPAPHKQPLSRKHPDAKKAEEEWREIDAFVAKMKKDGYALPDSIDLTKRPGCPEVRQQIQDDLETALQWQRFMQKCVKELNSMEQIHSFSTLTEDPDEDAADFTTDATCTSCSDVNDVPTISSINTTYLVSVDSQEVTSSEVNGRHAAQTQ